MDECRQVAWLVGALILIGLVFFPFCPVLRTFVSDLHKDTHINIYLDNLHANCFRLTHTSAHMLTHT